MSFLDRLMKKTVLPTAEEALPGRGSAIPTAETHFVNGAPLKGPFLEGTRTAVFGLGCTVAGRHPLQWPDRRRQGGLQER